MFNNLIAIGYVSMCLLVGGLVTYVHPGPHFMAIFNEAHYYYDDKKRERGGGGLRVVLPVPDVAFVLGDVICQLSLMAPF